MPKISAGLINLNYETSGEGEPLLLIMGFGMSGAAWLPMIPFMRDFKCIYFDNRGTGNSDQPDGPYTVAAMAEDASNLLAALDIPRAKIYGVSMGGMIAQELAIRHPEQVVKVVLGCTSPGGPHAKPAEEEVIAKLTEGFKLLPADPEKAFDMIMPTLYPPEFVTAHPELKQLMIEGSKLAPPTPPETVDRLIVGLEQFDAYDRLPRIKCPVLIVHGDSDVLVPAQNATTIKSQVPQAELFMIENAGHGYQAADPVGVHKRIVDWLKN
jgi:pimeloyl-ACP methyl ester carboxylesterase